MTRFALRRAGMLAALATVAAGLLAACATPPPPPAPVAPVKRVGVVSLIGDRVQWSHFGRASWDNRNASVTAADWGLDAVAAQAVTRALAPRIATVTLTPTPALRSAVNQPLDLSGWYGQGNARIVIPALAPVVAGHNLDAVVVLRRSFGDNDSAGPNRVNGVGVTSRGADANAYLWAVVFAYDLRTERMISETQIRAGGPAPYGRVLRLDYQPDNLAGALAAHRDAIRGALVGLLDEFVPPATAELGL